MKTIDALQQRIRQLVQLRAEAMVGHYYLARLGNQLQDEGFDIRRSTGASLEALLGRMGYEIDFVSNETDKFIYTSSSRVKPQKTLRFSKQLFVAFETSLPEGEQRFINLRTLISGTMSEVQSASDEVREISRRYITGSSGDRSADVVRELIGHWLEEQGLAPEAFVDAPAPRKPKR